MYADTSPVQGKANIRRKVTAWLNLLSLPNLLLLLLSRFSHVRLRATPQTGPHQAPLSLGFSREEHWSGLLLPSPLPNLRVRQLTEIVSDTLRMLFWWSSASPSPGRKSRFVYWITTAVNRDFSAGFLALRQQLWRLPLEDLKARVASKRVKNRFELPGPTCCTRYLSFETLGAT